MAAIEITTIESFVKDSEMVKGPTREFIYKLDDKAAKSKLIKGAKRDAFEVVTNSSSCNLVFNLGSWQGIVLPSISHWRDTMGTKSCKIDNMNIKVADVKMG